MTLDIRLKELADDVWPSNRDTVLEARDALFAASWQRMCLIAHSGRQTQLAVTHVSAEVRDHLWRNNMEIAPAIMSGVYG